MSEYSRYIELIFSVTIIVWLSTLSERLGNNEWMGWILMLFIVLSFIKFVQFLNARSSSPLSTEINKGVNTAVGCCIVFSTIFIALGSLSLPPDQFQSSFLFNSLVVVCSWGILLFIIPTTHQEVI